MDGAVMPATPARGPGNDLDRDAVCGDVDNCPTAGNPEQVDDDEDGLGTACDPCP